MVTWEGYDLLLRVPLFGWFEKETTRKSSIFGSKTTRPYTNSDAFQPLLPALIVIGTAVVASLQQVSLDVKGTKVLPS